MKLRRFLAAALIASFSLTACTEAVPTDTSLTGNSDITVQDEPAQPVPEATGIARYAGMTAEQIVATLTLEQKAAQMMQPTIYNVAPYEMADTDYGSILSKYEEWPMFTVSQWQEVVHDYQENALASEAAIPFFYGNDSLHGVNFASGCTIFPHNINIGAANDPELTEEYGALVGSDIAHTGMLLNFSPCVAAAQDPRWGRTYESYSSDNGIVTDMATAYVRGLIGERCIVCPKHFFGDGYTVYGTGEIPDIMLLDRGDAQMTDEQIEEQLSVYQALIDEGVQVIMLSHSSLNGVKMHENAEYISMLKEEMGFEGIVLSDWDSILNCSGESFEENVVLCINAGIDMLMQDTEHETCMQYIIDAVNDGRISMERIDDAVTRIIRVKLEWGLFDDPYLENLEPSYEFNSDRSHEVARELAAESFVPLKVGEHMYIEPGMKVYVMGPAADDVGVLCGGWTYYWQGASDEEVGGQHFAEGQTILEALQAAADEIGFEVITEESRLPECDMILLCIGEIPYAEWYGDTEDLSIVGNCALAGNAAAIAEAADTGKPTCTVIIAGRNVIVDGYINAWDSCLMCYLPGSEGGNAIADVLTGNAVPGGALPMPYYSSVDQIGTDECWHDIGWSALEEVTAD